MSQADSVKVTVGDHSYDCFKLNPWIMNEITHKILNTMGATAGEFILSLLAGSNGKGEAVPPEALAAAAAEDLPGFLQKNLNPKHLANGIKEALQRLDAGESRWLMEQLAAKTTIEGGGKLSDAWSQHFLGRPFDMYRWSFAALRSQYSFLE